MSEQTHVATADPQPPPFLPRHDRCAGCGATLAADQRYCVECGQRCGAPRLPFADNLAQRAQQPSSPARARRPWVSVNSVLIAGVGTLLLAMGVGVLIGRSGAGSSVESAARPAVQIVTVPGAGTAAAASTEPATSTESQSSKGAAGTAKPAGAASGSTATKPASTAAKKAAPSPTKSVTVGSPGKGAGYQKGHFTGNFFGE